MNVESKGSHRTRVRAGLGVMLALLVVLFVALVSVASAAGAAKVILGEFGTSSGTIGGQLTNGSGIAVNRTGVGGANSGDVYVADSGNNRVQRFDGNGNFIRAWGYDVIAIGKPYDNGTWL